MDSAVSAAVEDQDELDRSIEELRVKESDFAGSDPEELEEVRHHLQAINEEIEKKSQQFEVYRQQMRSTEAAKEATKRQIKVYQTQIAEAQRQREECRGWSMSEVSSLQSESNRLSSFFCVRC